MKLAHIILSGLLVATAVQAQPPARSNAMQLGNFSVSLAVRDINASKAFYEKLGFIQVFGNPAQHWVIMTKLEEKPRATLIGFFKAIADTMLIIVNWVLWIGPLGVFALAFVVGARAGGAAFHASTS